MKPKRLKATYGIEISRDIYEEIRIDETWDEAGKPNHSERFEEGYIWSELFGQNQQGPFDKWALNYHMPVIGGTGTLESFFENHFANETVRRKGLLYLYPDKDSLLSQEDYWKQDPRISWLYYKRSFDAVFPVMIEMGKTMLSMKIEGVLDDGRSCSFVYETDKGGKLSVDGKKLLDINFFDERYTYRETPEPLGIGKPEKNKNGKEVVTIYGVHSFTELFEALEMAYVI